METNENAPILTATGLKKTFRLSRKQWAMHLANPNMSAGEKGIMVGYEIGVAGGGILLAYGLANWWNPAGWVAIAVPIGYTLVTFAAGNVLQSEFENN